MQLREKVEIKVGLLGLSNQAIEYLDVISQSDIYSIAAIYDLDIQLCQRLSKKYDCECFDDQRQLILNSEIELLIDATNNQVTTEIALLAIKNKINILKLSHAGPIFEDLLEIVRASEKNGTIYTIANTLAYSTGFTAMRNYLASEDSPKDIYLLSIYGAYPTDMQLKENRWLSDPELSCGGVLMHNSYEVLQELIRFFSLPEQVYALTTNLAPDNRQRMSLTEDAAVLSLKFSNRLIGTLEASRVTSPANEYLKIYCPGKCITATKAKFTISDSNGNIIQENSGPSDSKTLTILLLNDLADVISTQTKEHNYLLRKDLALQTAAMIEASYLSFRTLMPEAPEKISKIAAIESKPIW